MAINLGPYDQYYFAAVVIMGTYAAAFFFLWISQASRYSEFIKSFHGIAQNFLTVINVIFALNLAFLANDTWNARDRALTSVYQEAGSLRNLLDVADRLPEPGRSTVISAIHDYAQLTVSEEWPLLARRENSQAVADQLDVMIGSLLHRDITSALPDGVTAQSLQQIAQIRSMRELRIALSQTHVNPLKWMGMAFLGFLTLISISMVHVDQRRAQFLAVLLFATAAAPTAAIILIHGNPFQVPMAISPAPIADVLHAPAHAVKQSSGPSRFQ